MKRSALGVALSVCALGEHAPDGIRAAVASGLNAS